MMPYALTVQIGRDVYRSLDALTRLVEGGEADWRGVAGDTPAGEFGPLLDRVASAWRRPGVWLGTYAFTTGPAPAAVIAHITLLEAVVHGWDLARVAPDDELAATVNGWARQAVTVRGDNVGPEVSAGEDADPTARLVAFLGRTP